jgi:hypothetical protein
VCPDPKSGTIMVSYLTTECGKVVYFFPLIER